MKRFRYSVLLFVAVGISGYFGFFAQPAEAKFIDEAGDFIQGIFNPPASAPAPAPAPAPTPAPLSGLQGSSCSKSENKQTRCAVPFNLSRLSSQYRTCRQVTTNFWEPDRYEWLTLSCPGSQVCVDDAAAGATCVTPLGVSNNERPAGAYYSLTAGYGTGAGGVTYLDPVGENQTFYLRWERSPNQSAGNIPADCEKWGTWGGGANVGGGIVPFSFSGTSAANINRTGTPGEHQFSIGCKWNDGRGYTTASNVVTVRFRLRTQPPSQQPVCPNDDKCNSNGQCWNINQTRPCVRDPVTNWTCWKDPIQNCSPGTFCSSGSCVGGVPPAGSGPSGPGTPPSPPSSPLPGADLKANGSDGPVTISSGSSANLSWTSSNAASCNASGDWSGSKSTSGSQSTGSLTSPQGYTLTCTGSGGSVSDSVTVSVSGGAPAPSVDLKANGSDGPTTIARGSSATLSWTSSNAASCNASGDWSGSKPTSGSQSTGSLTSNSLYSVTCSGSGGADSDSVTVNVSGGAEPSGPGPGLPPSIPFLQEAPAGPGGPLSQCSDGIDNDSDGLIDLSDPGCSSPSDNNEANFRIREIIPDFFNLNWFKFNFVDFFKPEALG